MVKKIIFIFIGILFASKVFAIEKVEMPISLDNTQNPWRAIGILTNNNKSCTAIVVGKYELITSAYCLLDNNGEKIKDISKLSFQSGYKNNFYIITSNIKYFVMPDIPSPPKNISDLKNSWAFLFTTQPVGNTTGVMKISQNIIDTQYLKNHKIITIGYTDNIQDGLFASIKCSINKDGIINNDKNPNNPSPLLLQYCKDYFKPLIGSPIVSIDSNNNISLIGIISAKITKNNIQKNNNEVNFNVFVTMTSLKP